MGNSKPVTHVALFIGGVVGAQVFEYLVHDYLLHRLGEKKDSVFNFHIEHHQRVSTFSTDPIYSSVFSYDSDRVKEAAMLFTPTVLLDAALLERYPALAAGLTFGSCLYFFGHALGHKYPELGWKYVPTHMLHHFDDPHDNYGVTTGLVDAVLRRLRHESPLTDREKAAIKQRSLRRYHERRSQLEKAVEERQAEQQKMRREVGERVVTGAFNAVLDGMNYVAEKRWTLERAIRTAGNTVSSMLHSR